ncbi:hypothetical protein GDO86_016715 [Hymenochirus boettgeri]|uniref:C2 domain-containing protein n=1 Tax=Hymenochirus boettgeri TaxID=247094 RepID=A0A8T2IPV3_9PIPI|nr:hypothetical protein GDO86_016715 [Hymenochirus boettgeri]
MQSCASANQSFKSKTIKENLNPCWREMYEDLEVDLYYEDPDKDDFLGSEVASGMVHLKLEWLSLMVEPDKISEPRNGLSTAMLITDKDPSTHVQISVGKKNVKSKTCGSTKDPVWEQAFAFFVQDIHMQHLHLKRFPLTNSGPNSNIKMKIVLRALHIEDPESDVIYTGINSLKHGPVTIKRDNKPQDKSSEVHQIQQNHIAPQANVESNELTGHSMRSTRSMNTDVKPAPNQNLQGTNTSQTLRAMRKFAPSLLSLNSVASSVYDGKGWPAEMSGEILITVRYASLRHCLVVGINSCRNLIQCSANGADPYVRIYLLPDRRWSGRKRTSVKKKTLDPQYDERFEYLVSIEDAKKRTLDIAVKNNRSFGSHERKELGKVLVDLSGEDLNKGFNNWYHLTPTGHPGP